MFNAAFFISLTIATGLMLLILFIRHIFCKFDQHTDDIVELQQYEEYLKYRLELQAASLATLNLEIDKLRGKPKKEKQDGETG